MHLTEQTKHRLYTSEKRLMNTEYLMVKDAARLLIDTESLRCRYPYTYLMNSSMDFESLARQF